jgi:hypothetical protein
VSQHLTSFPAPGHSANHGRALLRVLEQAEAIALLAESIRAVLGHADKNKTEEGEDSFGTGVLKMVDEVSLFTSC